MKMIVLLGAPGAGKGTQAERLAGECALSHLSTGDILREAVQSGSPLGAKVGKIMEAGDLVPDELVGEVVRDRVAREERGPGLILDGFPRTVAQANYLTRILPDAPVLAVNIRVDEEHLLKRLTGRRSCVNCGKIYNVHLSPPEQEGSCDVCGAELVRRKDDREEIVRERLSVYRRESEPLIDYYQAKGNCFTVDGGRNVDTVFEDLRGILRESGWLDCLQKQD